MCISTHYFQLFSFEHSTDEISLERKGLWRDRQCCGSAAVNSVLEMAEMGARMLKCLGFGWQFCMWLWAAWGFIAAFHEHSCVDPTISHMLGSAVLAQLVSAAVTRGHFCSDRQAPRSSNGYKYSWASVILKPILNHQKVISTHVFSMLGLANVLFLDCCLKKKNLIVLKGTINFLSTLSCKGALKCLNRFRWCIFCFHSCCF